MKSASQLTDRIMTIVRDLAEFSNTSNVMYLSRARHAITDLAVERVAVADSLWDIALYLQRELLVMSTEDDEDE